MKRGRREREKLLSEEGTSVKQPEGTQLEVAKTPEPAVAGVNTEGHLKRVPCKARDS